MSKSFQVVAIIKKLLSFWKDFKNHFKHKLIYIYESWRFHSNIEDKRGKISYIKG
jgi:hypothetical protein